MINRRLVVAGLASLAFTTSALAEDWKAKYSEITFAVIPAENGSGVTERYTRPSLNHLIVEITVDDPKVLEKPWKSAPRRWTLGSGDIYEFYCTNNKELEELEKLRAQELQK